MKRVFILTILLCSIFSNVLAFEPPDPNRWEAIGAADNSACWIDTKTLKFRTDNNRYSDCYTHRFVTVWIMWYYPKTDTHSKICTEFDLDCRTGKDLAGITYDSHGKAVSSLKTTNTTVAVPPESVGEAVLLSLEKHWQKYKSKINGTLIFDTVYGRH